MGDTDILIIEHDGQQFEMGVRPFDVDRIREVLLAIPSEAYAETFGTVVAEILLTCGRLGGLEGEGNIPDDERAALKVSRLVLARLVYPPDPNAEPITGPFDENGYPWVWRG